MTKDIEQLIYDDRPIEAIVGNTLTIRVGEGGVTRIVAYGENGVMGLMPWAAVYKGEFLWKRVDLAGMMVIYKESAGW